MHGRDPTTLAIARHDAALDAGVHPHPADELAINLLVAADTAATFAEQLSLIDDAITTAIESAADHPDEPLVVEVLEALAEAVKGGAWGRVEQRAAQVKAVAGWVCKSAVLESSG
ncbi:MAG: hypothetical protein AAGG38_07370 [Planctomycetota bacterium]